MRLQDAHSVALLLAQSPVFGLLDSAERQRLVERCRVDRFDVRSLLCGASDAPDRLWLVLEGQTS